MPFPDELQLSAHGQAVWRALARYALQHGYAPSHRDLQRTLGLASCTVQQALVELEHKGYLWPPVSSPRPARSYCLRVWPQEVLA